MTDFRENVIDIIDEWESYNSKFSCVAAADLAVPGDIKKGFEASYDPAFNAGHVQIKCFINNTCPFYKTPYTEHALVFNSFTYSQIVDSLPDSVSSVLTTTEGVEGIYFKPRKVFRHNYINRRYGLGPSYFDKYNEIHSYENFTTKYEDITVAGTSTGTSGVFGADQTRYRREHDWVIVDSVFDNLSCRGGAIEECRAEANWVYVPQTIPESRITSRDIEYDYFYDYWKEYTNSFETVDGVLQPKKGETTKIEPYSVQMPMQSRVHGDSHFGIHWRLHKRTPLFQGTDFFIRFYKMAQKSVTYSNVQGNVPFNIDAYKPLDHTLDGEDVKVLVDPIGNFTMYANDAVRMTDEDKNENKPNIYDFFTQAYYIIEMAYQYFIVIPARGNPIFVHFFRGENANGIVSKILGEPFAGVTGSMLINAKYFDIVVRNHLGRLIIQFEAEGVKEISPWIIERTDWVPEKVKEGETSWMTEKPRDIYVPKGHISIWGGNIRCGFLFGFLQYADSGYVSFLYPPRDPDLNVAEENSKAAFVTGPTLKVVSDSDKYFGGRAHWLPLNGPGKGTDTSHHISFEAYGGEKLENGSIGDQSTIFDNVPLFTQDAQYYKDYHEGNITSTFKVGYFYYNYPIREFSPQFPIPKPNSNAANPSNKSVGSVRTSNITIRKYQVSNFPEKRHQGFTTYIGMMIGDHYFTEEYYSKFWEGIAKPLSDNLWPIQPANYDTNFPTGENMKDIGRDSWFLPSCKTPILTNIRLISDSSPDPRWEDDTNISQGVNRDPEQGESPYFIDATDHVMSFSHAWSTSGLTSLEHSGTIQFYLNYDMNADNNVTPDLISLQDKTFYIEVWAGYRHKDDMANCGNSSFTNYTRIPGFYKMFTGMCLGGSISYEYGKNIMTCKLEDYTSVLKGMIFFNSPWFDAMKDIVAIREIVKMSGLRDEGPYDPGHLLKVMTESVIESNQKFYMNFDGRNFKSESYALPSGYARLTQPSFKFNDGDAFIDGINKISKVSAKIFYFDEWGIAHYEDYQDIVEEDFKREVPLVPLYQFTTNPDARAGQLVFGKVERSFDVNSIVNHLKVMTNTPDMHLLIRDHIRWSSIENPEIGGFIGYQKTFYQAESMFGSKEAQISTMNKYAVFFKPIIKIKFETYGLPLRATDIVSLNGEVVRVVKVDHSLDAEKNLWWMQVECDRFQAIDAADLIPTSPPPP